MVFELKSSLFISRLLGLDQKKQASADLNYDRVYIMWG